MTGPTTTPPPKPILETKKNLSQMAFDNALINQCNKSIKGSGAMYIIYRLFTLAAITAQKTSLDAEFLSIIQTYNITRKKELES